MALLLPAMLMLAVDMYALALFGPALVQGDPVLSEQLPTATEYVFLVWLVAYLLAAVGSAGHAVRLLVRRDVDRLQQSMRIVKYGGVPFFVVNFVLLVPVVLIGSMMAIGVVLGPLFVVATYLIMLPTSAYGLACLLRLLLDGSIGPFFFLLHAVLHLVFVLDVVSTVLVARRARQVRGGARAF